MRAALSAAPLTDKKLLELGVSWAGLESRLQRFADVLRRFVITWDPLELIPPRPEAIATVNADPPGLELVVYVPCWSLEALAADRDVAVGGVLGALAGSAVLTAAAHEDEVLSGDYPDDVVHGAAPDLLVDVTAGATLGAVSVRLVSPGWEDIGLGAITDIVQQAFGVVDLDRSPVELAAARSPRPGCPGCAGRRFGFPAELAESRVAMCDEHQSEATAVMNRRLARANASNPDGWGLLTDASTRLGRPHLPNGLATRLAGADEAMYEIPEPDVLAERADLVVEAAGWFGGRPTEFAVALGEEPDLAYLPDWLVNFVLDLGRAGLGAPAVAVGDALTGMNPEHADRYAADVACALAEAGDADQARDRVAAMLAGGRTTSGAGCTPVTRWPRSATSTRPRRTSPPLCRWRRTRTTSSLAATPSSVSGSCGVSPRAPSQGHARGSGASRDANPASQGAASAGETSAVDEQRAASVTVRRHAGRGQAESLSPRGDSPHERKNP